jgi:hypothetical protein
MSTRDKYRPFLHERHFNAASNFQIGASRGRRMASSGRLVRVSRRWHHHRSLQPVFRYYRRLTMRPFIVTDVLASLLRHCHASVVPFRERQISIYVRPGLSSATLVLDFFLFGLSLKNEFARSSLRDDLPNQDRPRRSNV